MAEDMVGPTSTGQATEVRAALAGGGVARTLAALIDFACINGGYDHAYGPGDLYSDFMCRLCGQRADINAAQVRLRQAKHGNQSMWELVPADSNRPIFWASRVVTCLTFAEMQVDHGVDLAHPHVRSAFNRKGYGKPV